jgi:hypothetical protein
MRIDALRRKILRHQRVAPNVPISGGALKFVPWQFIHHRPLQRVVIRLAQRRKKRASILGFIANSDTKGGDVVMPNSGAVSLAP